MLNVDTQEWYRIILERFNEAWQMIGQSLVQLFTELFIFIKTYDPTDGLATLILVTVMAMSILAPVIFRFFKNQYDI